jgi:hypothetical protein
MKEKPSIKIYCVIEPTGKIMRKVEISGMSYHEAIGIIEGVKFDLLQRSEKDKIQENG